MILIWKDMTSFCRHLHEMKVFRQLHQANPRYPWGKVRDMPIMSDIQLQSNAGGASRFYNSKGKPIVVPIWRISPPKGIQN
jgi:hypothetical protein